MDFVSLVPRLYGRYCESNLVFVAQTIRSVTESSVIDRILWSKCYSKFISPFLQIIRLFVREGEIYYTITTFYSIWKLIVHLFAELIHGVLV